MTTAEVIMKPVATHSICSRSTPNVLIMCGRATLTMLESRTAMNVPSMMMPRTPHRLPRRSRSLVMRRFRPPFDLRRRAGVDPHLHGQARPQRQLRWRRQGDAQRHPLGNLDEGARDALGGNEAEFGVGRAQ